MKVLYLLNKRVAPQIEAYKKGIGHDSGLYGMLRLPKYGVETDYLEIEQFIPVWLAKLLRRYILTMHYAHLPLFPLFFRYDIVFTSTAYASLILKAFLHIKKFKWVVLDFNVLGTIGNEKKLKQKLYAYAVSKADGIICISEAARDAMRKRFPHLGERVVFMHEANDPNYFKPNPDIAEENEIISVGNFGRDFDTVIEATKGLDVKLTLATKLILPEKAKTLPPHVTAKLYPHDELARAYARAKIAVVGIALRDDWTDSVGTFALGDAMCFGKAVIVTHTKSMESYVRNGVNGFFVPYKDVDAVRQKIKELLVDESLRRKVGVEARKFAVEYLDPEHFAKKLAAYFGKL